MASGNSGRKKFTLTGFRPTHMKRARKKRAIIEVILIVSKKLEGCRVALLSAVVIFLPLFSACTEKAPLSLSTRANLQTTAPPNASYAQFTDIPVPAGAKMDLDRTLVFGEKNLWIGRLVFTTELGASDAYDFFTTELPRFGWQSVTMVRSRTNILIYTRDNRAATLAITGQKLGGSTVLFSVSPLNSGKEGNNLSPSDGIQVIPLMK